jgi:pimeloyl-ACP methyl ester carboxylesterase
MTTGQSMVELPHARIPGGPETLVILEGLTLENKAPTGRALWLLRWAHKRYTRDYTVYQVARRPGLPAGHTTRDMADDYASWIGARFDGPVDVIGFSTGGEVAQYLAADHGELVRRLVLSDTGCRLGEDAKALLQAARDKATHGRAAEAQADIANHIDFGRFGQGLVKLLGRRLMKEPDDASDYIATIEDDLGHDATDVLARIVAPTLVIAGSRDFLYPARLFVRLPSGSRRPHCGPTTGSAMRSARPTSAGSRTTYWASCALTQLSSR